MKSMGLTPLYQQPNQHISSDSNGKNNDINTATIKSDLQQFLSIYYVVNTLYALYQLPFHF